MRFSYRIGIHRAAVTLVAISLVLVLAIDARATTSPGPGPFANVRVTSNGLLITLKGSTSIFSGEPRIDVSDGGPWIACDRRATVKSGGSQLLQKGTVAGVSIGDYFPQDESRRLRIRNGDGGTTELDLVRAGDGFLIAWTNRTPSKGKRLSLADQSSFDALSDRSLTVRPGASVEPAFDVVVALTNPPLPPDANDQSTSLLAVNLSSGELTAQTGTLLGDGRVTFHHVLLPAGTYRFDAFRSIAYGNPLTFLSNLTEYITLSGPVTVGRDARTVSLSVPDVPVPASVPSTIVVDGVAALSPSISNRVTIGLSLSAVDGPASLFADREVTTADPVTFDIQIPPGAYRVQLSAGSLVDGSSRTSTSISLGEITIAEQVQLEIPPLARFRGSILDPDFRLFTDGSYPGDVSQRVGIQSLTSESPRFSALSSLFGFSRGYQARVPVGGTASVSASVALDAGGNGSKGNAFGRLDFTAVAAPVVIDGDVEVDFQVPDVPGFVTLSGTALDRGGNSTANAFVYTYGSDVEGLPGATYSASTTTDRDGAFTLRVLRGRSYRIIVIKSVGFEF